MRVRAAPQSNLLFGHPQGGKFRDIREREIQGGGGGSMLSQGRKFIAFKRESSTADPPLVGRPIHAGSSAAESAARQGSPGRNALRALSSEKLGQQGSEHQARTTGVLAFRSREKEERERRERERDRDREVSL